jgi:hypothetical protein
LRARSNASRIAFSGASFKASSPKRAIIAPDNDFPRLVKGKRARIEDRPPLIYHFAAKGDTRHHVDAKCALDAYAARRAPDRLCLVDRYALRDTAFKVVGVGSATSFSPMLRKPSVQILRGMQENSEIPGAAAPCYAEGLVPSPK